MPETKLTIKDMAVRIAKRKKSKLRDPDIAQITTVLAGLFEELADESTKWRNNPQGLDPSLEFCDNRIRYYQKKSKAKRAKKTEG